MKRWWQRQSTIRKYCIATLLTGMGLILFWALLSSFDDLWKSFVHLLRTVGVLLVPFLAALLISYALSPAVNALERGLNRISRGRLGKARVLAVALLYAAILGLCFWVAADFVPKLLADLKAFARWAPNYFEDIKRYYEQSLLTEPALQNEAVRSLLDSVTGKLGEITAEMGSAAVNTVIGTLWNVGAVIFNVLLSLVLSFYLLSSSRQIFGGLSRFAARRLGRERTRRLLDAFRRVDWVFGRYIGAKLLEAIIVFVMCQAAFWIIPTRYGTLMSLTVALCGLVPYVGSIFSGAAVLTVTLLQDPSLALWTAAAFVVIRIADAWWIAPRVVGDKLGLHPFWVLAVVLIGWRLAGVAGMLLAVPVAAVVKTAFAMGGHDRKTGENNPDGPAQEMKPPEVRAS